MLTYWLLDGPTVIRNTATSGSEQAKLPADDVVVRFDNDKETIS